MYKQTFYKFACHAMKCTVGEYYTECIPCKCDRTLFQKYFDILVAMYQQTLYKFACHAMKSIVGE